MVYDDLAANRDHKKLRPGRTSAYFTALVDTILRLMGYCRAEGDLFEHCLIPGKRVHVSLKDIRKKAGQIQIYCCVGSDHNMTTILAIDEEEVTPMTKQHIIRWIVEFLKNVAQRLPMPKPHYGCMFVLGEDFGSATSAAKNSYDLTTLRGPSKNKTEISYIRGHLQPYQDGAGVRTFLVARGEGRVVEYTIVRNQTKERTLQLVQLFFSMGYVSPVCVFSGFATAHTGDLVVRATAESAQYQQYSTITYEELCPRVDVYQTNPDNVGFAGNRNRIAPPSHLGNSLVILNSPYAHAFAPPVAQHSPRASPRHSAPPCDLTGDGKCVHKILPLTTPESPLSPTGGMLKYLRKHAHLLPEQYLVAFPAVRDVSAPLPTMHKHIADFVLGIHSFKFDARSHAVLSGDAGTAAVKSGVYVFPSRAAKSATYVVYDKITKHAVIVDSGDDAALFYERVWVGFIMRHVSTYDVVITGPESACTTGFVALAASRSFQQRQKSASSALPRCQALYFHSPLSTSGARGDALDTFDTYADVKFIADRLRKAGVEIVDDVSATACLYSSVQRSLHAEYMIRVDVLAPSENDGAVEVDDRAPSSGTPSRMRSPAASSRPAPSSSAIERLELLLLSPEAREGRVYVRPTVESRVALLVRGWTKVPRIPEPKLAQYVLGTATRATWQERLAAGNARNASSEGAVSAGGMWERCLLFPPDY
jgi:hypothetical protein